VPREDEHMYLENERKAFY